MATADSVARQIKIAQDFSKYPAGRYLTDGDYSGERFRNKFLKPLLEEARTSRKPLIVELDGVRSFGSSFLEEAFGGLIRKDGFSEEELDILLKIECTNPAIKVYSKLIWKYISEASARKR